MWDDKDLLLVDHFDSSSGSESTIRSDLLLNARGSST
jgi:hypothetical protein